MNIVIIGGVAAGTKAAAKLMRQDRNNKVTIYTKSKEISYAGCGLPYYVGGSIETRDELIVNTPEKYMGLTGADVKTEMEAVAVDAAAKTVTFANGDVVAYDKLIIATGAVPFIPNVPGVDLEGVFKMRTPDDAIELRDYVDNNNCRSAVVVGAGFIGLEVAENLLTKGLNVTVIDMAPQIMPNLLDAEMADYARRQLQAKGIRVMTAAGLTEVVGAAKATGVNTTVGSVSGDVVVLAIGVKPATGWLESSGIEMNRGTIVVDKYQRTNLADVYAAGDCAQVFNRLTGKAQWSAMGSTANITSRLLAKNLTGFDVAYGGCLGTGVVKLAEGLNAGRTGLTEEQAKAAGYDVITATCVTDDKAHFYTDASTFVTKLIADKTTRALLGIQVIGGGAVDKMVDIAVTGIAMGAKVDDFDTLDFAYAPPFSTAIHPFVQACYILENKMSGAFETFTPAEYAAGAAAEYTVLDVHPAATLSGAKWVDLAAVNGPIEGIDKDANLLLVCAKGKRGYFLQNRLKAFGYTNTRVVEGGAFINTIKIQRTGKLTPEDIKRVKALGCLQDKRYEDVFNVRVITRNGKITSDEHRTVAEAADIYGTGAVAMTTRLTLEIQGVKYDDIDPLIQFLNERGVVTGGTGSLVRPVVSCKGTTCQYGLCDAYGLSDKIHEAFYVGYHGVTLPHKFKICVGGCPNNCAKPGLNDLGVIGQKVPVINYAKCHNCTHCQVVENCPIKVAEIIDGKISIDPNKCNNCGRCDGKCPFGALEDFEYGFKIYLGGRWGKKITYGKPISKIFKTEEEVMEMVELAILFFREEGISGERFADTIDRLGFAYVEEKLLSSMGGADAEETAAAPKKKIDKEAILKKTVKGGATC